MTAASSPVRGNRHVPGLGDNIYGRVGRQRARPAEDILVPGLTLDTAKIIGEAVGGFTVKTAFKRWSLPGAKLLENRGQVSEALGQRSSPAEKAAWSVGVPYLGEITLASVVHVSPNGDPFTSLASASTTMGQDAVRKSFGEALPVFKQQDSERAASYKFQQSAATDYFPVVVRTVRVAEATRHIVLSEALRDSRHRPLPHTQLVGLAVRSAFAVQPDWQDLLLNKPLGHGDTIFGDAADLLTEVINEHEPTMVVPIASALVLSQQWTPSRAAAA